MAQVFDTPIMIDRYRHLATYRGLKMEIEMMEKYKTPPAALPTRGMAFDSAKRILAAAGKLPAGRLTRKKVLVLLVDYYVEIGLIVVADDGNDG